MTPLDTSRIWVHWIDLVVIAVYLLGIILLGVYLTRLASRNVDSYFLGGNQLPWWLLGLSGTSSYFDLTGVMWTIGFFYILGQRCMWLQWEWGFLMMAFIAAYMGKWIRRSGVMTGAEWMSIRFGTGPAGELARIAYALLAVVIAAAFIGFAEYGCGHFLHLFIPKYSPHTLAIIVIAGTSIYTIAAGLMGVVITDVIQFGIVLIGSFFLIAKAIGMSSYPELAAKLPAEWFGFAPVIRWDYLKQWEISSDFTFFIMVTAAWVGKGFLLSVGGPQQLYDMQRFLATRTVRDASKAGMLWGVALTPMFMVSIAVAVIGVMTWGPKISDPEHLYPVVIGTMFPIGVKGIVLAGLLSAFMANFSATVNAGASYLIRDGYQYFLRPRAGQRELVHASRIGSALLIVSGVLVGVAAKNIDVIFSWIMMTLGTAVLMPNILRWFWWRFNGFGYAVGTIVGVVCSIGILFVDPLPLYTKFAILLAVSSISSIMAALMTQPTDIDTLTKFYVRIRPAGWWAPIRKAAENDLKTVVRESFVRDFSSALVGAAGLQALFLAGSYACTHQWVGLGISFAVLGFCAVVLYFTW